MAKLDEDFFNSLEFGMRENKKDDGASEITINCTHQGIYRQYAFGFNPKFHNQDELPQLEYQAKRIVAWTIDKALKNIK